MKKERCRHERNSWIIFGGFGEWCFVCGAWRRLQEMKRGVLVPKSKWYKPSGDKNINPWK